MQSIYLSTPYPEKSIGTTSTVFCKSTFLNTSLAEQLQDITNTTRNEKLENIIPGHLLYSHPYALLVTMTENTTNNFAGSSYSYPFSCRLNSDYSFRQHIVLCTRGYPTISIFYGQYLCPWSLSEYSNTVTTHSLRYISGVWLHYMSLCRGPSRFSLTLTLVICSFQHKNVEASTAEY